MFWPTQSAIVSTAHVIVLCTVCSSACAGATDAEHRDAVCEVETGALPKGKESDTFWGQYLAKGLGAFGITVARDRLKPLTEQYARVAKKLRNIGKN